MNLRTAFTAPPKPLRPWLRHGYLVFCLILLGWDVVWWSRHGWTRSQDSLSLVLVALPLNHVAFRYDWPPPVRVILRSVACVWIAWVLGHWLLQLRPLLPSGVQEV